MDPTVYLLQNILIFKCVKRTGHLLAYFRKGKEKEGRVSSFVVFPKIAHVSAISLGNGTNAHSKMVLEGFSADRAHRKLLHICIYSSFYTWKWQCNAAFSCSMQKENWNTTVQNAAADLMSFKLQNNSARLITFSGKSQPSCCHQQEGWWELNGLSKVSWSLPTGHVMPSPALLFRARRHRWGWGERCAAGDCDKNWGDCSLWTVLNSGVSRSIPTP